VQAFDWPLARQDFPATPFRLSFRERMEWRGSHDMAGKAARAAVEAAGAAEIQLR